MSVAGQTTSQRAQWLAEYRRGGNWDWKSDGDEFISGKIKLGMVFKLVLKLFQSWREVDCVCCG